MSINPRRVAGGKVVYDVRLRTPDGRQYKRTFRTKREAELFEASDRTERSRGGWVDPAAGRTPLGEYAERWLRDRKLRPRTAELYEGLLRLHILPTLGEVHLADVTTARVRSWLADLDRKRPGSTTPGKAYRLLRVIMNTAVEDGLVAKNPCRISGAGSDRSPERPVATIPQVYELADAVGDRYRAMVLLATFGGLRLGELLALAREDLHVDAGFVRVRRQLHQLKHGELVFGAPKSDAGTRDVMIPPAVIGDLTKHLTNHVRPEPEALVFTGEKGGPLRRHVWAKVWDRARRHVGVPHLHFHDLRHTGNTLAAATGASTKELMARMGHASPEAALRYQHATRDRDAAIADTLSRFVESAIDAPSKGVEL